MKSKFDVVCIIISLIILVYCVYSGIMMQNAIREYNESLDKINVELDKITRSMVHNLLVKYDKIAKPDTLTLEQKVDIMSLMMTNYIDIYYNVGHEFNPQPHWNQWIETIKDGMDSEVNEEVKE